MKKSVILATRILFISYCAVVVYVLLVDRQRNIYNLSLVEYISHSTNLIPFKSFADYVDAMKSNAINTETVVKNIVGNIALFFPLGFFVPALFRKLQAIGKSIMVAFGAMVAVETLQLVLMVGVFDIDDFILYAIGFLAGYVVWKTVTAKKVSLKQRQSRRKTLDFKIKTA